MFRAFSRCPPENRRLVSRESTYFYFLPFRSLSGIISPSVARRLGWSEEERETAQENLKKLKGNTIVRYVSPRLVLRTLDLFESFGFDQAAQRKMVDLSPSIFIRKPAAFKATWEYFRDEVKFGEGEMRDVVSRNPALLGYDVDEKIRPFVAYLREGLGLTEEDIACIFRRSPQVLSLSLKSTVRPRIEELKQLGVSGEDVSLMVKRRPQVLAINIQASLHSKLDWLAQVSGVSPSDRMGKGFGNHTHFISASLGELMDVYANLTSLGFLPQQCAELVGDNRIPTCKQDLQMKVEFSKEILGKEVQAIVEWPEYLAISFPEEIACQTAYCRVKLVDIQAHSLRTLFADSNLIFADGVQICDRGDFLTFKSAWMKLSAQEQANFFNFKVQGSCEGPKM